VTLARRWALGWPAWFAGALGLYLLGGWIGAAMGAMLPGFPIATTNSIGSVMAIFQHNLAVLAFISAGWLTFGLTTAGELFLNGTLLGFIGIEMVERHRVQTLVTAVAPQLFFELGAYVIAAGATLRLGWSVWWPLMSRRARQRVPWRAWVAAEAAAVIMLFAGAIVEVLYSHT
jgi:uncharacterized membrane protein SpoIIM required for sporulation